MGLKDFFKQKPKTSTETEKEKKEEKKVKPEVIAKEKKVKAKKPAAIKKAVPTKQKKFGNAYRILKIPHVTEKATDLTSKNQYIFKVWQRANKPEVKKAVEEVFGVEVLNVRIINVPGKERRLGKISGWRKGYKKAIVRLKEGQKIEVLPR